MILQMKGFGFFLLFSLSEHSLSNPLDWFFFLLMGWRDHHLHQIFHFSELQITDCN